jgi:hypothetical protein
VTTLARRADQPRPLALPDSIARAAALLEAAGFAVIEPVHSIREVWHLVAHTAQHPGLLLVGVFAAPPDPRRGRRRRP